MANKAGARIVDCTHEEPPRNDEAFEREFEKVLELHPREGCGPECRLAIEGVEIEI